MRLGSMATTLRCRLHSDSRFQTIQADAVYAFVKGSKSTKNSADGKANVIIAPLLPWRIMEASSWIGD